MLLKCHLFACSDRSTAAPSSIPDARAHRGKAKEYLIDGQTVAYACFSVGFDSISSFTGLFKRRTGRTPRQFQVERISFQESVSSAPLGHVPACFAEKAGWTK